MTLLYFSGDSNCTPQLAAPLVARLGWTRNTPVDGVGGSGYVTAGSGSALPARLTPMIAAAPDAVFVIGGGNDGGTDEAFVAAVNAYWTALRTGLPNAELWAAYCWTWTGEGAAARAALLRDAVVSVSGHYVDITSWMTGTGKWMSPAGDGNRDIYLAADGVHLSDYGKPYIGVRMAHAIRPPATGLVG